MEEVVKGLMDNGVQKDVGGCGDEDYTKAGALITRFIE